MILRKLRLKKGWSQEQLAQISGLNVRTIQRIERGQAPSLESKKSLAAAFEVQLATFDQLSGSSDKAAELVDQQVASIEKDEANMKQHNSSENQYANPEQLETDEHNAIEYARGIKEFYNHLFFYVVFASMIAFVKGFDDSVVIWGLLGWTVGVVIHGLNAYELINIFNANWERKLAEKKLGRKL